MVIPDSAGYVNEILQEIFALHHGDVACNSHRQNLLDDFSFHRLSRKADSIRNVGDRLSVKALLVLNHDLNVAEAMRLFSSSVTHFSDDVSWVNMIDQLAKRGFFSVALDVSIDALKFNRSLDILRNVNTVAKLTHNIQLMEDIQNILRNANMLSLRGSHSHELSAINLPRMIEFNTRLGLDNNAQSRAIADVLDLIVQNDFRVSDVTVYSDNFFETLPVRVKIIETSLDKICHLNEEILDLMISKGYDLLKLSILIEGTN